MDRLSPDRLIIIPLPGIGTLALDSATFRAGLLEGEKLNRPTPPEADPGEPLLDADKLGKLLDVPAGWLEQAARENKIPSLQFGRWRRFRRADVEAAIALQKRLTD